jgi:lycopene beta-cyclase
MKPKRKIIILGSGLAGSLLALRFSASKTIDHDFEILLLEKSNRALGDTSRTWSFHHKDLDTKLLNWIRPWINYEWTGYDVYFPKYHRTLSGHYYSIHSDRFRTVLNQAKIPIRFNSEVTQFSDHQVTLSNGEILAADLVIDARGFADSLNRNPPAGFQKFLGLKIKLHETHGLKRPVLMDARIKQIDGYRFIYCLPYSENTLLIEDTRYSSSPELNKTEIRQDILNYAHSKKWKVNEVMSDESGVLPIPYSLDFYQCDSTAKIGVSGGFFHPITGYSFPDAVKLADILTQDLISHRTLSKWKETILYMSHHKLKRIGYELWLNQMMFQAASPSDRYQIFQRFYGLSERLIERFYASELTRLDQLRILLGRPPVSIMKVMKCWINSKIRPTSQNNTLQSQIKDN